MVAVGFGYVFANDGEVAAAGAGRELEAKGGGVDFIDFDGNDFLQLLDAALHLYGFGGFIAEAFDEALDVGNLFLLVFVGSDLAFPPLSAQLQVFVVTHLVVYDLAAGDLDGATGYVVDECSVVAYQYHRVGLCLQKGFKPLDAFDVEVVGGLVKQEDVGLLQQELGQFDAHAPTAAELAGAALEVAALEAQSHQGTLHVGASVLCSHHLQVFGEVGALFDESGIVFAFVVLAFGQLLVDASEFFFHFANMGEGFFGFFNEGGGISKAHDLRQVADGYFVGAVDASLGGLCQSGQNFQQGGFAGTVLANEGYAFFVVDDK